MESEVSQAIIPGNTAIRFFTDEDLYAAVAPALRRAGFEALSTPETDRLSETDGAQLEWAASEGLVIVSFNVADFAALHANWMSGGRHHAGIVLSKQLPLGELLRRLTHLATALNASEMIDRLEYLSDW